MSLFKKEKVTPAAAPAPKATVINIPDSVTVNLTDKMLRVELVEDEAYIRFGKMKKTEDTIRIVSNSGILVAEITKRSKAYAELESKAWKSIQGIKIKAKQGDYGIYYQLNMKLEDSTEIIV